LTTTEISTDANQGIKSSEWILCTLFEGDYHLGLAALVNSLAASGFKGCIWAGYRGKLPPWTHQLRRGSMEDEYVVTSDIRIVFVFLETHIHFTNMKPEFMRNLVREHPESKYICYFDPDITIKCEWRFFIEWVSFGIALCEDVTNGTMPENHPLRLKWMKLVVSLGLTHPRSLSRYFNGGFVGLPVADASFLELWQRVIDFAESQGVDTRVFGPGTRIDPFYASDQDALNIAAMYTEHQLTTIGPEGMGLVPGGFTMYHALGSPKPWRKKMIRSALFGIAPSSADKAFLLHSESPIHPYKSTELKWKRFKCNIGALIGRFYRRQ
jgi:hypothetical protein